MLTMGIDEAGRGAMLGPLVVAGIVVDEQGEKELRRMGVKDSKKLTPKRREELAPKIEAVCKSVLVMRVQPCRIDKLRGEGINLDKIEAIKMAEIISMSDADTVFVDSLTHTPKKFMNLIMEHMEGRNPKMNVENYADETYPVVSAASIIAKVERDAAIDEIKKKVNVDFGVGYSHDKRTIEFVEKLIQTREPLPSYVRQSWITTQLLQEASWQRKLKEFFRKEECGEEIK